MKKIYNNILVIIIAGIIMIIPIFMCFRILTILVLKVNPLNINYSNAIFIGLFYLIIYIYSVIHSLNFYDKYIK
jgi:hypothetical protein